METEIFNSINCIENISKKWVTFERTSLTKIMRKINSWERLRAIIDDLINSSKLDFGENDSDKSYFIPSHSSEGYYTVLALKIQEVNDSNEDNENSEDPANDIHPWIYQSLTKQVKKILWRPCLIQSEIVILILY